MAQIIFQSGIVGAGYDSTPWKDTRLSSGNPNDGLDTTVTLSVGREVGKVSTNWRTVLRVSTHNLGSVVIDNVGLVLYILNVPDVALNFLVYPRLTQNFGDRSFGDVRGCSYNYAYHPSMLWPGGAGALGDCNQAHRIEFLAATTLPVDTAKRFDDAGAVAGADTTTTLVAAVQDAVDHQQGLVSFFLKAKAEGGTSDTLMTFSSSQSGVGFGLARPALVIDYHAKPSYLFGYGAT